MKTKILLALCSTIFIFSLLGFNFQEEKIEKSPTKVVNSESRQKVIVIDAGFFRSSIYFDESVESNM